MELREAVEAAARRPEVWASVEAIYDAVQKEIDVRRPVCVTSGRCCNFETYGHRLYVTTLELATFVNQWSVTSGQWPVKADGPRGKTPLPILATDHRPLATSPGCPFQVDKLCSVHTIRPFGCRMFFCDATAADWQNQTYERFQVELKTLHESLSVPYFYTEWRQALRALGLVPQHVGDRNVV